jgi:hypothetical protein
MRIVLALLCFVLSACTSNLERTVKHLTESERSYSFKASSIWGLNVSICATGLMQGEVQCTADSIRVRSPAEPQGATDIPVTVVPVPSGPPVPNVVGGPKR